MGNEEKNTEEEELTVDVFSNYDPADWFYDEEVDDFYVISKDGRDLYKKNDPSAVDWSPLGGDNLCHRCRKNPRKLPHSCPADAEAGKEFPQPCNEQCQCCETCMNICR